MRTVIYSAACSLDGFIGREDGGVDWLHFSADVRDMLARFWARVDTVLMGRKTWEIATAGGGGGAGSGGPDTYVFSRTLTSLPAPARLVREDAAAVVRDLKARDGKDIFLMGGGDLARSLLAQGVVDRVELNVHPVLLGRGIPFFRDPGRQVDLVLDQSRVIDGGCLSLEYRVAPATSPGRGKKAVRR